MAASAAATVKTKITNVCPSMFRWYRLNATSAMPAAWNISSVHRNMMIRFRLVRNPITPIANITTDTNR